MATRSTIAIQLGKEVRSIYCHWDGYISHNGMLLFNYYDTEERVLELIEQGNISSLGKTPTQAPGHTYDTPVEGCTVYYGRDRGEKGCAPRVHKSVRAYMASEGEEYNYLFKNGKWYVDGELLSTVIMRRKMENEE